LVQGLPLYFSFASNLQPVIAEEEMGIRIPAEFKVGIGVQPESEYYTSQLFLMVGLKALSIATLVA